MGSVTAKIMREAKEARTMGEAGVNGGAEAGESTAVFDFDESYPGGAPEAQFNPEKGRFETNLPPTESFYTAEQMPGGTKPSSEITSEEGKAGGGGAGLGKPPETPTLQKEKDQTREQIKQKRKRRRSLISEEEEGELGAGPVYRRSILGG